MKAIPPVSLDDKAAVRRHLQKLASSLGPGASPTFAGLTVTGLTASTLLGANVSKLLESVTVGTGLDYTRPNLTLSHLGIEALTDPGVDKILFWDDSATPSACKWLGMGNSIAITTTTIDTIQDIRTSASPQFTGIELGHATDTTITRASAGDLNIEGNIIYRAGGTDVPLTDGGTGASSAVNARTNLDLVIGTDVQAWDAGLDSLAALTYVSDSFIKVTAENTYAIRTIAEIKTDLSLNLVENTALSTWAGTTNITILGTIATGTWASTDVGIAYGGTGQSTAQLAINALSAVSGATNEHVLTKDTGTGNATFKAAAAGATTFVALTDTPANYTAAAKKVSVVNEAGTAIAFASNLYWDETNDRLSVGSATPLKPLYIEESGISSGSMGALNTVASGVNGGAGGIFYSDDGAALVAGDRLGFFLFGGSADASHYLAHGVGIVAYATATWSSTTPQGAAAKIVFETCPGGGTLSRTARLTINSDGGIYMYSLKSGADQAGAGANANELYRDTDDNSIKIGV